MLMISKGGAVLNTNGYIGHFSGSIGTVTVDEFGIMWNNSGFLNVGYEGSGTLNITGGGNINNGAVTLSTTPVRRVRSRYMGTVRCGLMAEAPKKGYGPSKQNAGSCRAVLQPAGCSGAL